MGGAGGGPAVGEQLLEPALRLSTEASEDVSQTGEAINAQPVAGGDETVQEGGAAPAGIAAEEEPVLAADRDAARGICVPLVVARAGIGLRMETPLRAASRISPCQNRALPSCCLLPTKILLGPRYALSAHLRPYQEVCPRPWVREGWVQRTVTEGRRREVRAGGAGRVPACVGQGARGGSAPGGLMSG